MRTWYGCEDSDGRMFYMCHAYLKGEGFYAGRQPILQEMEVTDDHWVRFKTGSVAVMKQPVPFKGTNKIRYRALRITLRGIS